jgi:hypothetical protein
MRRRVILFFAVIALLIGGCAQTQTTHTIAGSDLKRITQLDLKTNQPVRSWNARADTIKQRFAPPVGVTFVDADTGQTLHFDGSFRIESYRPATGTAPVGPSPAPH